MPRLTRWLMALALGLATAACGQTDPWITTAVKAKLVADDAVKAYQIDVDTKDKVVTLTGIVDTGTAKARAVQLARDTDGVRSVIDSITVQMTAAPTPPPDAERVTLTDPTLTGAVKAKLLADPAVSGLRIDVDTSNGVVTLTGEVRSQAEKDQALRLARETAGVKRVEDKITVVP